MKDVHCSPKQRMVVKNAYYRDSNQTGIYIHDENVDTSCSAIATCRMKSRCNGKRSCEVTIDNTLLPSQFCLDVSKELYMEYTCVDAYSSTSITTGKVDIKDLI